MIEGSGSGAEAGSRSIPLANGSRFRTRRGSGGSGSATLGERKVTEQEHFVDFFGYLMCLSEELPYEPLFSEARWSKVAQGGVAQ